ncbi:MAG: DUF362 domain-containing protein [Candidatus Scalinduaceae bacterium]
MIGKNMTRSIVVVKRTKPDTVLSDFEEIIQASGLLEALDSSRVTILKDNITWHFPFLSANTTPWQLEGTILALKNAGFNKLVAVHNNTVVTNPYKGGILNKLTPIYKKYGIEERYNFLPEDIKWITYKPKAEMRVLNNIYKKGIKIPEFFIDKNIVHLPTMKTHIYTQITGAMKNAFGGLLNTRRHYTHSVIHETLVDLLAIQKEIHAGIFAVMDGTICGSGPGPRTMQPVEKDYILASSDSVAIDAVSAKMMGFNPMKIPFIRLAHEDGLGKGNLSQIEVSGEDISMVNFGFQVGDNLASLVGDAFWFSPAKMFQRLLFHTPLVYAFVLGSYIYHDYVWWPFKGKRKMAEISETKWGKLFASYDS